ncbi:unnamed protein product [Trichogramma brassicae]|uniref:Uncharacterized protein n=1 Tax=Trichogramma brassicae TaxID=86971 RepID=A0A6H5IB46_9HYME|nr:unnamed protein product [Trichogramma brassicae]
MEVFFKICDEKNQTLQVDAKDKKGRTSLYYAVTSRLPNTVDLLLNRGADLSKFVFPTESDFDEKFKESSAYYDYYDYYDYKLNLASGILGVIEQLEKRGYELDQSDALTIMKLFAKYELFEKSQDIEKVLNDDEEFAANAKKIFILPKKEETYDIDDSDDEMESEEEMEEDEEQVEEVVRKIEELPEGLRLSLYDLIQLRPEEAQKQLTYSDYYSFWKCRKLWNLPEMFTRNDNREAWRIIIACQWCTRKYSCSWCSCKSTDIMYNINCKFVNSFVNKINCMNCK